MSMLLRSGMVLGIAALMAGARTGRAADLPREDKRIIEAMLEGIKDRKDLKFLREKKIFDAKSAAWYMKYKWDQNKEKVKSVEDFIALQSVGGKQGEVTYYVQFADGTKKTAREVLEAAVKQLRADGAKART